MKIELRRQNPGTGGFAATGEEQTCVIEWGDNQPLPVGAKEVAPQTKLHDWETAKPDTKTEETK